MEDENTESKKVCLSWRMGGRSWRVEENGNGEELTIRNSLRKHDMGDLEDADLEELHVLIGEALKHRRWVKIVSGDDGVDRRYKGIMRDALMRRSRAMEKGGVVSLLKPKEALTPINEVISREKWAKHIAAQVIEEIEAISRHPFRAGQIRLLEGAIGRALNTGVEIEDEHIPPTEAEIQAATERRACHIADSILGGRNRTVVIKEPGREGSLFGRLDHDDLVRIITMGLNTGLPIPETNG